MTDQRSTENVFARVKQSDPRYDARWLAKVRSRCQILPTGCWIWTGIKSANGYGQTAYRSRTVIVHRQVFLLSHGPLGRWEYACHECDVKLCCNPAHLWKGTPKENQQDSISKGRHHGQLRTHCKYGHEFTPKNTRIKKQARGYGIARVCRQCEARHFAELLRKSA